ncbi:MAG TPA: PEP-CTERM sorting domain-containing protein [Prosthecobacter sp.]
MRTFLYWLLVSAFAVLAAGASEKNDAVGQIWTPDTHIQNVLPVPEPSRAMLLGLGIMAIAFTYRQAWLNLKRKG